MSSLLVLNPNTSSRVTERLVSVVRSALAPAAAGVQLEAATARFGARYIASEASYTIAAHAVLDAYESHVAAHGVPDAVLVGCFGDPGVQALREMSGRPAIGLAEAAMRAAQREGPYVIVTGGTAWEPMLWRFARAWQLEQALAGIYTLPDDGAALAAAQPDGTAARLRALAQQALRRHPTARCVVLGGAGLAGQAGAVGQGLGVPVIDSVAAGASAVLPWL
jgi:Asp/Glu/hydantoin racemase